jgi:hypothetical protein
MFVDFALLLLAKSKQLDPSFNIVNIYMLLSKDRSRIFHSSKSIFSASSQVRFGQSKSHLVYSILIQLNQTFW